MEQILVELVGLEQAQQLRNTLTLDLAHENLRLVQLSTILYHHRWNKLHIELAARPIGEDLPIWQDKIHSFTTHLKNLHQLTEKLKSYKKGNQWVLWETNQKTPI